MKKGFRVLLCAGLCLGLSACGSKEEKPKTNASESSREGTVDKIADIDNWVTDLWCDSLNDLVWYINNGTSDTGGELNPEITLKEYNKEYKKAVKYNKFMSALKDEKYQGAKEAWDILYQEMEALDNYIQMNGVAAKANPDFNADLFKQAHENFSDNVASLKK